MLLQSRVGELADGLVRVEVWLRAQPPEVQAEVDRWWDLMIPAARETAVSAWSRQLAPDFRQWLVERLAVAAGASPGPRAARRAWPAGGSTAITPRCKWL